MGKGLDFTYLHGVGGGVCAGGSLETGSVESVHAREDVELLAEQCFEALLAFVAGVNLDASILDHSELVF